MDIERETKGESGAVARGGGESTPRAKSATPQSSDLRAFEMDLKRACAPGQGAEHAPLARVQLAMATLLEAALALVRRLSASATGELQRQRASHALVHALLPVSTGLWFRFAH